MAPSTTLVVTLLLLQCVIELRGRNVTISTQLGRIRGSAFSANSKIVYNFNGIPYAEPPVGDRRFVPSLVATQEWDHLFDATKPGSKCLQPRLSAPRVIDGDEDCLFLNIFTTKTNVDNRGQQSVPVMV